MTLLGPLERDRVTSLVGVPDLDLLALTVAIAVSVVTGEQVIPGWRPAAPEEVTIFSYGGDWCLWKSMTVDVCAVAGIPVPMLDVLFPSDPLEQLVREEPPEIDPHLRAYWAPYREADEAAVRATGRDPLHHFRVIFGDWAIGFGSDGALANLYKLFDGMSTLWVGSQSAFHEANQLTGPQACDFGPVHRLADLRDSTSGVRDFFRTLAAVRLAAERLERARRERPRTPPRVAAHNARLAAMRADAFFASEPAETLRAILQDGRSPETHLIKVRAKAYGITSGQLWHAAKRLEAALANDDETPDNGPGTLTGYTAVFDAWVEVDRWPDGNFMQRLAPGCFSRTIEESKDRMRVNFMHGRSPQFGRRALGPTEELALLEDDYGLRYTLPLFDTEENRQLAKGLKAGLYGSSYSLSVVDERFVVRPGGSAHNPKGLPERTILEARLPDFGPVASPLYPSTSASIRK